MKIDPDLNFDKTLTINESLEELYRLLEELEQQVRAHGYPFKQGVETDQATTSEVQPLGKIS